MKDKIVKKIKTKASDMIILALMAFLSLRIPSVVEYLIVWTPLIDTVPLGDGLWTLIMNLVCIAVWFGLAVWFLRLSRLECGYNVLAKNSRPSKERIWIASAVSVGFIALVIIFLGGFSFPYEIRGVLDVIYTLVYYAFLTANAAMSLLVIVFGQKFGDIAFGGKHVPWGGIVLGIGMALSNIISGLSNLGEDSPWMVILSAAIVFVYALIYGVIYVIADKKPLYALPFIAVIFLLL